MVRHLHDIGWWRGSDDARDLAIIENREVGTLVRKYMKTMDGVDGEATALASFTPSAISPPTPTAAGSRSPTSRPACGLYAQRIVTRKHYDLEHAKRLALSAAGLSEDDVH